MKTCSACKISKASEEFHLHARKGLQDKCKECQKVYAQKHYRDHKQVYLERAIRSNAGKRADFKQKMQELKSRPCMDCGGVFDPVAMDFDHKSDKHFSIATGPTRSWERVLAEVAKCDLVCANCHRVRTRDRLLQGP